MSTCEVISPRSTGEYSQPHAEAVSHSFASPFTQPIAQFVRDLMGKVFPKKQPVTTEPPSLNQQEETFSWNTLDFDKLVEEACLKIWGMLREHLKQINQYHEEQEKIYREAIKEQVKSYLSWVGTALQVASIATGICSISFTLLPGQSTDLCKKVLQRANIFHFDWFEKLLSKASLDLSKPAKAAGAALETIQKIFGSCSTIHGNYANADRTSAGGTSEICKLRMDKLSKEEEAESSHRDSLLRTIEEQYRREAEDRKAISR